MSLTPLYSYLWSLLYLAQISSSIVIILKASLKYVPVVGFAMQFFRFIVRFPVSSLSQLLISTLVSCEILARGPESPREHTHQDGKADRKDWKTFDATDL